MATKGDSVTSVVGYGATESNTENLRYKLAALELRSARPQGGSLSSDMIRFFSVDDSERELIVELPQYGTLRARNIPREKGTYDAQQENCDSYVKSFKMVARSDFLEYGEITKCDLLIEKWRKECGELLPKIINAIFLSSLGDRAVNLLLLKAIGGLPYKDIYPFAQVQAMAALCLEDVELAEAGIRVFENWGDKAGVEILEKVKMREGWLEDYRVSTIEYLKGI